ncbi:MAG: hypothetical protein ACK4HD_14055 [Pannonibacter phragmitetus]
MSRAYSDDELAELTDEERAGLAELLSEAEAEDGEEADEGYGDAEEADEESEAQDGDEGDSDSEDLTGEDEEVPSAAADDESGETEADESEEEAPEPVRPAFVADPDIKDKISDIDKQLDELAAKFDEGDLTAKELRAQSRALEDQRQELREQIIRADVARDAAVQTWRSHVGQFIAENPAYKPGTDAFAMLDDEVKRLQVRTENPFDPSLLKKAHQSLVAKARALLGQSGNDDPTPKADGKKRAEAETKKPGSRQPKSAIGEIPQTLAQVPASDTVEVDDGGKFGYLNRLADSDPLKYEMALARLSQAERDAYLAS